MKLLLIIVLIGAAVATEEKEEKVVPAVDSAVAPVAVVAGIPGIKAFQYSHPGFVQKFDIKQFTNGPLTYSVPSVVPTQFTNPTIKAVGFKPLFTGFEGYQGITGVDVVAAEETAVESDKPVAEEYSADATADAVAPVDTTEVVESEFPVAPVPYFGFPHNFGFAPSVYSVAGGVPAVGHVSTLPFSQVYTGSNRVFTSPTVYSAPSVYSSPFFYHNQGIAAPAVTNLLASPQHVSSYVYRFDNQAAAEDQVAEVKEE